MKKFIKPMIFTLIGLILGLSINHFPNAFISKAQAGNHICQIRGYDTTDMTSKEISDYINNGYHVAGYSTTPSPYDTGKTMYTALLCK